MKLFAAIRPPASTVRELTRLQRGVTGAKWSAPEKLHITLGFFGEVNAAQADVLKKELTKVAVPDIEIQLSGAGHFGENEPHAIWIGVASSPELTRLHEACCNAARAAGIKMETRPFMPHITLAYLKRTTDFGCVAAFENRLSVYAAAPFMADGFNLYSSWAVKDKPNIYRQEANYRITR